MTAVPVISTTLRWGGMAERSLRCMRIEIIDR
jgi:hypothetical protein